VHAVFRNGEGGEDAGTSVFGTSSKIEQLITAVSDADISASCRLSGEVESHKIPFERDNFS
jgi:hypothetical protein